MGIGSSEKKLIGKKQGNLQTGMILVTLLTAEIIKWQKCGHIGLNGFHMKCIIGTHCN